MKRVTALFLVMVLLLCLAGCGCRAEDPETTSATRETPPSTEHRDPTGGGLGDPNSLKLGKTGRIRVTYTINLSSVRYITSVDQLPNYAELKVFDEEYFREKALIVVFETVTSGTVHASIESVTVDGNTASVKLSHTTAGGIGTGDMTTWLLWAEVDRDLAYRWVVENPAVEPNTSNQ